MYKIGEEKDVFYTGFYTAKAYKLFKEALSTLGWLNTDFMQTRHTKVPCYMSVPDTYVDAETKEVTLVLPGSDTSDRVDYLKEFLDFAYNMKLIKGSGIDVKCSFKSMSLLHYALSGQFLGKSIFSDEELKKLKGAPNNPIQSAYAMTLLEEIEKLNQKYISENVDIEAAIDADIRTAIDAVKDKWKKTIEEKQKQSDEAIADLFSKVKECLPGFLDSKTIKASRNILRQQIPVPAPRKYSGCFNVSI